MALTKLFTTDYGVSAEHHELRKVNYDYGSQSGQITVQAWKDSAAEAAGNEALGIWECPVGGADSKEDSDGVWVRIKYAEIEGKSTSQIETYLKGGKVRYGAQVVDMSGATGP